MLRLTTTALLLLTGTVAFTPSGQKQSSKQDVIINDNQAKDAELSRRSMIGVTAGGVASLFMGTLASFPSEASAKPDCLQDCIKNCKLVVPNDTSNYCRDSCLDYCEQPDRRDGLSGSVSSEGGEVGILGGTFGQGTVVKGEDKPPIINLPGLNFNSGEGRKLIG